MIISFGELLMDMIKKDECYCPHPGGAPANFAVGCAKLGEDSSLIASVGNDVLGEKLVETVSSYGVDTSMVKFVEQHTTLAFVELNDAKPEFFFYRWADKMITSQQIDQEKLSKAKVFHFGSLSLTEEPVRSTLFEALENLNDKTLVSFDPNIRKDLWKEEYNKYLVKVLPRVDVLLPSKSELVLLSKLVGLKSNSLEAMMERLAQEFDIKHVAVTLGADGSKALISGEFFYKQAFDVKVVDTTGAGDSFSSAFIVGLLEGMEGEKLLEFCNAAAALTVTRYGTMEAMPTRREVEEFLSLSKR